MIDAPHASQRARPGGFASKLPNQIVKFATHCRTIHHITFDFFIQLALLRWQTKRTTGEQRKLHVLTCSSVRLRSTSALRGV